LPSTEPGYKRSFDERDRLYSKRTGVALAVNSLRQNASDAMENAVERIATKLQPQVAPQVDPAMFGLMASAVVKALKDEGLLAAPAVGEEAAKPAKQKANAEPKA
jgi:hypothetical protein